MNKFTPRGKLIAAGIAVTVVFIGFCVSASLMGPWWRFESMPSAEEWQALFGATVLVALVFAWLQVRQVESSNRELVRTNDLVRQANLEISRPRVSVFLEVDRQVKRNRAAAVGGTMSVAVRNIGHSPALNVRLSVDVPFTSMAMFFVPGTMPLHFAEVNAIFDGTVSFPIMNPGTNSYAWILGYVPRLFSAPRSVPRRYAVTATYDSTGGETYSETMVLDLDVEKRMELPAPPLVRIGKDLETVGAELKQVRLSMQSSARATAVARSAATNEARRQKLAALRRGRPRVRRSK